MSVGNDPAWGEARDMWSHYAGGSPVDSYPQTVEEEALIKNNNTCKDFLIEAMKYHLLPLDQRLLIKNPRTKPRTPVSLPKVSPGPASADTQDCPGGEAFHGLCSSFWLRIAFVAHGMKSVGSS